MNGQQLRRVRKRLGLTQRELGREVGISRRSVIKYEAEEYANKEIPLLFSLALEARFGEQLLALKEGND